MPTSEYKILFSQEGWEKADRYCADLRDGSVSAGGRLEKTAQFKSNTVDGGMALVEALLQTKSPQIFAESDVCGDGSDWNNVELSILGDVSIAVPVKIYDDGAHSEPNVHKPPFAGTLIYTCGALLRADAGKGNPADWPELAPNGDLVDEQYFKMYERRLVPCFQHANDTAQQNGTLAFITIPGLGCGQFAGPFRGQLGSKLCSVLERILTEHGAGWPQIAAVYYDAFNEGSVDKKQVHGIEYIMQPLKLSGSSGRSQLCTPGAFQAVADGAQGKYSRCDLFSFVAWDHVSWPGNDYWVGDRATDDGVKAAATDTMFKLTHVEGRYSEDDKMYVPPPEYATWLDVVTQLGITLDTSSLRREGRKRQETAEQQEAERKRKEEEERTRDEKAAAKKQEAERKRKEKEERTRKEKADAEQQEAEAKAQRTCTSCCCQ